MPREKGYKDAGDRVVIINPNVKREAGIVLNNDGFGEIWVKTDSGGIFHGYEKRDLIYEDEDDILNNEYIG